MFWFLGIILVAVALLAAWVGWRERRYGGLTRSDAVTYLSQEAIHGPSEYPWSWQGGRRSGGKEDQN